MKTEYSYNRNNLTLISEEEDKKIILDIRKRGKWEAESERLFIDEILTKFGFGRVKDAPHDLFPGPLVFDMVSKDAYYYSSWAYCNFLDQLLDKTPIIWDKVN